ncbi:hypothetical protein PR202_gb24955 [Eleusine coracana subsp. coracana]|uniref:Small ribosomal subunit protein mS41 SAM domain-containing protein n=1 Tax=Eleusine coracana subsp. coracana TaxID=191504 RepID=A0AAV5FNC2_ELECO|nr:hypothetical protein PR202_gb24955 [Eleusine coracana subsp. coracana]
MPSSCSALSSVPSAHSSLIGKRVAVHSPAQSRLRPSTARSSCRPPFHQHRRRALPRHRTSHDSRPGSARPTAAALLPRAPPSTIPWLSRAHLRRAASFKPAPELRPDASTRSPIKDSCRAAKVGVVEFLNGVGKGVETHAVKIEEAVGGDLQRLLETRTLRLKKLGVPCKHVRH